MNHLVVGGRCLICGNRGFPDRDCPSCGKKMISSTFENLTVDVATDDKKIETKKISLWNPGSLKQSKAQFLEDNNFTRWVDNLTNIYRQFESGKNLSQSVFIIAPAGFGKETFAESCLAIAKDFGFSTAPILDTVELKRLLVLSGDRPYYKIYGNCTYDDYMTADVCFISVTKLSAHEWAYEPIMEVLSRRGRMGLPTIIISRYSLDEISRRDISGEFYNSITAQNVSNRYKYPAIVKYLPYGGVK